MNNISNLSHNTTVISFPIPIWQPIVLTIISFIAIIDNGFLLVIYIKDKRLKTSFTVYIINIIIFNLISVFIGAPYQISNNLFTSWILGRSACSVFHYSGYILKSCANYGHSLIVINRIWAITFPVDYSRYHTRNVALLVCVGTFGIIHLIFLPGYFLSILLYPVDFSRQNCTLDVRLLKEWAIVCDVVLIWFPEVIMILSFPFI